MNTRNPTILVSCGETSGDIHASVLVKKLLERMPGATIIALGGDRVRDAGAELLHHLEDYAVLGFSGILANLPKFYKLERSLKARLETGVDLFIPVDYPGLNLRLAAHAHACKIPVLYYICPQVWAWGRKRIAAIERTVDALAMILPFEERLFTSIRREFVGHPFIEDHALPVPLPQAERDGIGLLPGSRVQEVKRVLPVLLKAAEEIARRDGEQRFTVSTAPWVPGELYRSLIAKTSIQVELETDALDVMRRSRLVLVASGTATLQAALMETPLIIVYKVSWLNYLVARRLITIDRIGLVNIVLGEHLCPEFIQENAKPSLIAREAERLLAREQERERMVGRFRTLKDLLRGSGGCSRVAELAQGLLESSNTDHGGEQ
jgi:lipid-A-disaccharide synthase